MFVRDSLFMSKYHHVDSFFTVNSIVSNHVCLQYQGECNVGNTPQHGFDYYSVCTQQWSVSFELHVDGLLSYKSELSLYTLVQH